MMQQTTRGEQGLPYRVCLMTPLSVINNPARQRLPARGQGQPTEPARRNQVLSRRSGRRDVNWLTTARRFPGEPRFPGLRAIAMVEAEVERRGSTSFERRDYLSSPPLDAKLFVHAVRCHWHVENRLHRVLDAVLHEDLSRLRSGAGPQDMATVRHMAINLLRGPKDKHSLKVRRKSAAWDINYLETLLRQSA